MTPRRSLVEQAHLPAGVGPRSWATRPSAWSRRASLTIPLCASLAVLFLAPLALGAPPRTYESKIEPGSVEVGGRTSKNQTLSPLTPLTTSGSVSFPAKAADPAKTA